MEATDIFNGWHCVFWMGLALIILCQGVAIGDVWQEQWRFMYGFVTLYGSTLLMVWLAGWDGRTWALLVVLTYAAWLVQVERRLTGGLWTRRGRENHRWTLRYFAAYLVAVPFLSVGGFEVVTWLLMLISLGVCGGVKVGREAWQKSLEIRELSKGGDRGQTIRRG